MSLAQLVWTMVLVSLAQVVRTMHNICKVGSSNLGHHQKSWYGQCIIYAMFGVQTPSTTKKNVTILTNYFIIKLIYVNYHKFKVEKTI